MSKLEKLKEKARGLEAKDARAAIAAWLDVIKEQESEGEPNPDLSIFNRIGDLAVKVKDSAGAADWYDRAVDKYAELGFHNNAIAMCNKVLRNAPGRQTTYFKLAKLYAAKGFMAEAQQNFVTYAERMQKAGKLQQAFAALKEFTDISPESEHLRVLLEEHLRMYGEPRPSQGRMSAPAPAGPRNPPERDTTKSGKHTTPSPRFPVLDEPPLRPRVRMPRGPPPPAPGVGPVVPKRPPASPFKAAPAGPGRPAGPPPRLTVPKVAPPAPKASPRVGPPPKPEAPKVKPVVPRRPPGPPAPPKAEPPKRKTVVEGPPPELEPAFAVAATDGSHDVAAKPLAA